MKHLHQHSTGSEAVRHWWKQRLTAVILVPLGIWFVVSLLTKVGSDYQQFVIWLRSPFITALMIGFLVSLFYHGYLGMQVVIEDYVSDLGRRAFWLILLKLIWLGTGLLSIIAVLFVALGR